MAKYTKLAQNFKEIEEEKKAKKDTSAAVTPNQVLSQGKGPVRQETKIEKAKKAQAGGSNTKSNGPSGTPVPTTEGNQGESGGWREPIKPVFVPSTIKNNSPKFVPFTLKNKSDAEYEKARRVTGISREAFDAVQWRKGEYDRVYQQEKSLRKQMKDISLDNDRRDAAAVNMAKQYRDNTFPAASSAAYRSKAKELYDKFVKQDNAIAEYRQLCERMSELEDKGIKFYNTLGQFDEESVSKQARRASERASVLVALQRYNWDKGFTGKLSEDNYTDIQSAEKQRQLAQSKKDAADYYKANKDNVYTDSTISKAKLHYRLGDTGVKQNDAGYVSYANESDDIVAAQIYQLLSDKLQRDNEAILNNDTGLQSKINAYAEFLPQQIEQTKYSVAGGVVGAVSAQLASPFLPGIGLKTGWDIGSAAGSAYFGYRQAAGGTFLRLLSQSELSVDEAAALAKSASVASAAVEFGLEWAANALWSGSVKGFKKVSGVDLTKSGTALIGNLVGLGLREKTAKKILEVAKFAGNSVFESSSEYGEEWYQAGIEQAVDRHAKNGTKASPLELLLEAIDLRQYSGEQLQERHEAGKTSAFVSAVGSAGRVGGISALNAGVDALDTTITGAKVKSVEGLEQKTVDRGKNAGQFQEAKAYAEKLNNKIGKGKKLNAYEVGKQYELNLEADADDIVLEKFIADVMDGTVSYENMGGENGRIDLLTRQITINKDGTVSIPDSLKHEFTHFLKRYAPERYAAYQKFILNAAMSNNPDAIEARKKQLIKNGYKGDELDEELGCEVPELFFQNREIVMNMARRKPEASGKIYEIIQRAKNAYHRSKGTTFSNRDGLTLDYWQLNEAERLWREAINEAEAAVKATPHQSASQTASPQGEAFDGDVKRAVKTDKYGNKYWDVETEKDIFAGIRKLKDLKKAAYDYLFNGASGETVTGTIDGTDVVFNRIGAKEYVYGRQSQELNKKGGAGAYAKKMRIAPSIDDLIKNSDVQWHSPDMKQHKEFPGGFDNYRGRVGIDGTIFEYVVRVGKGIDDDVFYDVNLELADTQKDGAELKGLGNNPIPHVKRASAPSFNTTIPQSDPDVKRLYTNKGDEAARVRAEKMEAEGATPEQIWKVTGWARDLQGNWVTEIDDSGAEYDGSGVVQFKQTPEYKRYVELMSRYETLTDAEKTELNQLDERFDNELNSRTGKTSEYLHHPDLYSSHPELGGYGYSQVDMPSGNANFDAANKQINVNKNNPLYQRESSTFHEIQHALQNAEGRAGGSSVEYWARWLHEQKYLTKYRIDDLNDMLSGREDFDEEIDNHPIVQEYKANPLGGTNPSVGNADSSPSRGAYNPSVSSADSSLYTREPMDAGADGPRMVMGYEQGLNDARRRAAQASIAEHQQKLSELEGLDAKELYRNTAGEIEARDAASRINMTAEERRDTFPEAFNAESRDKAVFAVDNGNNMQYNRDRNMLTTKDWNEFYRSISELKRGKWFPKTGDGEYILETSDKLIFTDGDYINPSVSRVISFEGMDAESIEYGKEHIWNAAIRGQSSKEVNRAIEYVLGYESDARTDFENNGTYSSGADSTGEGSRGGTNHSGDEEIKFSRKDVNSDYDDIIEVYYHGGLGDYGISEADMPFTDMRRKLSEAADKLKSAKKANYTDEESMTAATTAFEAVARDIINHSYQYMNGAEDNERFTHAKSILRSTPIYIPEYAKSGELGESYNTFHKKNIGKLRLVKDGSNASGIEDVYADMRAEFPEYFPELDGAIEKLQHFEAFVNSDPDTRRAKMYTEKDVPGIAMELLNAVGEKMNGTSTLRDSQGNKLKLSQLFKNTLHKQHYEPEFTMEVDARASDFTYDPIGNRETYESAQSYIEAVGEEKVLRELYSRESWSADDTALSLALIEKFNQDKDYSSSVDVAMNLRSHATKAGQAIQAISIVNRLTPEGQYMLIERENQKMIKEQVEKMPPEKQEQFKKEYREAVKKDREEAARRREKARLEEEAGRPVFVPDNGEDSSVGSNDTASYNPSAGGDATYDTSSTASDLHSPQRGRQRTVGDAGPYDAEPDRPRMVMGYNPSEDTEKNDNTREPISQPERNVNPELREEIDHFFDDLDDDPAGSYWRDAEAEQAAIDAENAAAEEYRRKTHVEDLLELYNIYFINGEQVRKMGSTLHDIADTDSKSELIGRIREQSKERKTVVNKTVISALEKQDIDMLKEIAIQQVFGKLADTVPETKAKKVSTFQAIAQLLNLRTMSRNVTSNAVFNEVDNLATDSAAVFDCIIGLFTKQRSVAFQKGMFEKGTWSAKFDGAVKAYLDRALDVQTAKAGSRYEGLETSRRTFKGKNPIAAAERWMGYGLNVTDEWTKAGIEHNIIASMTRLRDSGRMKMTDEEIKAYAEEVARYRTFQDDTAISQLLGSLKDTLNIIGVGNTRQIGKFKTHEFGLGDVVQKYTRVPGNLISRFLEYSPTGYMKFVYEVGKAAKYVHDGGRFSPEQQRKLAMTLGRAVTGTGLMAAFYTLSKLGIFTGERDDETKEQQELEAAEGIASTQLNLSALSRWIASGFDNDAIQGKMQGDTFATLGFMEPLNTLMALGYGLYASEGSGVKDVASVTGAKVFDQVLDMSTMYTMRSIFNTIQYGGDGTDVAIDVGVSMATGFVPSMIRQAAEFGDKVDRNPYSEENSIDKAVNRLKLTIPGLRQTVPAKVTPFGEERRNTTGNRVNDFLNSFVSPGYIEHYQTTDVSQELYELCKINEGVIPSKAPQKFSVSNTGYALYGEEYEEFAKAYGQKAYNAIKEVVESEYYGELSDDEKAEAIADVVSKSATLSKQEWASGHRVESESVPSDAIEAEKARLEAAKGEKPLAVSTGKYVEYDGQRYELSAAQKTKYDKLTSEKTREYQSYLVDGEKSVENVVGKYQATYYYADMTQAQREKYLAEYDKDIAGARKAETREKYKVNKQRFIDGELSRKIEVTGNYADLPDNIKRQVLNRAEAVAIGDVENEMRDEIVSGGTSTSQPGEEHIVLGAAAKANNPSVSYAERTVGDAGPYDTRELERPKLVLGGGDSATGKTVKKMTSSYNPSVSYVERTVGDAGPYDTGADMTDSPRMIMGYSQSIGSSDKPLSRAVGTTAPLIEEPMPRMVMGYTARYNNLFNDFVLGGRRLEELDGMPFMVEVDGKSVPITGNFNSLDEKTKAAVLVALSKKAQTVTA